MVSTWGFGKDGRLGLNSEKDSLVPLLVPSLAGQYIAEIACGARFTLAMTNTGRVYAWGSGKNGECGEYFEVFSQRTSLLLVF
jgi:alpha-tubulin suppressor-like RCC1 family protein